MKNHHVSRKAKVFSACFFLVIIGLWSTTIEAQEHMPISIMLLPMEKIRFITDVYNRITFAPERNTLCFVFTWCGRTWE